MEKTCQVKLTGLINRSNSIAAKKCNILYLALWLGWAIAGEVDAKSQARWDESTCSLVTGSDQCFERFEVACSGAVGKHHSFNTGGKVYNICTFGEVDKSNAKPTTVLKKLLNPRDMPICSISCD
ncbi:MAG: hypothetical protein WCH01_12350 [Methylococcaceae bacterium]